ncbi:MAG: hypothetical protein AB2A00_07100 [Myxococcota bacterium]
MDDVAFLRAFEDGTLPPDELTHRAHVRVGWLYLTRYGDDDGARRIDDALRRYVAAVGAADRYHVTLTRVWIALVQHALRRGSHDGFDAFMAANPELGESRYVLRFYSEQRLWSEEARARFVAPDVRPLPTG